MMTVENDLDEFEFVQKTRRFLLGAQALSRVLEETLIDLVAAYTPWLAPLIPAAIGFTNIQTLPGFNPLLAFIYAAVVEFLGLATVTTALEFRAWNVTGLGKRAPFWMAILTATFYLTVTLSVNVLLDTGSDLQKWVKGLASTFSVVGAITLALRSEQTKRVAEHITQVAQTKNDQIEAEDRIAREKYEAVEQAARIQRETEERAEQARLKAEEIEYQRKVADEVRRQNHEIRLMKLPKQNLQKVSESELKVSAQVSEGFSDFPETFGKWKSWLQVPDEYKLQIARFIGQAKGINSSNWKKETVKEIQSRFGVDEKIAYNWISYAERDYPLETTQGGA